MIPSQMKQMLGIKDEKDLKMANNIWKMLDDMAQSDPSKYQQFIEKNIKEGLQDAKEKKQEKDKPFKVKPHPGFKIQMDATLCEQVLPGQTDLTQKLNLNSQNWTQVKQKMEKSVRIHLNICHSQRVRLPNLRNSKKEIKQIKVNQLPLIQNFYYSLQGPYSQSKNSIYFCLIINSHIYESIFRQGGKKILLGLSLSYLQERLRTDRNPLQGKYDPLAFGKNVFYNIEKMSVQISSQIFKWKNSTDIPELLLEKQVDQKRFSQIVQEKADLKKVQKKEQQQKIKQIKFKKEQMPVTKQEQLPTLLPKSQQPKKKVIIEVLKQTNQQSNQISYQMKQTEIGYHFEFLLTGVNSIEQVNLDVLPNKIKVQTKQKKHITIDLTKKIDDNQIKAKFKKKLNKLIVDAVFKR